MNYNNLKFIYQLLLFKIHLDLLLLCIYSDPKLNIGSQAFITGILVLFRCNKGLGAIIAIINYGPRWPSAPIQ